MKERLTRLKTIRRLIKTYRIESQEALLGYLSREGYAVTQPPLSRNIVVIKTYSGQSDVVATSIDSMNLDEVRGCISGRDNCVFVCLREGVSGEDFFDTLKLKIPELDE